VYCHTRKRRVLPYGFAGERAALRLKCDRLIGIFLPRADLVAMPVSEREIKRLAKTNESHPLIIKNNCSTKLFGMQYFTAKKWI
jgi:hypothetical protein